jgi:hypothetical protein
MPTPTYTLIDSVTLGSSASSVTFSSIDQSFGDLVLVVDTNQDVRFPIVQFNGSTTGYSRVSMYSYSGSVVSDTGTGSSIEFYGDTYLGTLTIMDYSATDKHKTCLLRNGEPSIFVHASAQRWADTSAITQIYIGGGTYVAGSTFYLYGIEA